MRINMPDYGGSGEMNSYAKLYELKKLKFAVYKKTPLAGCKPTYIIAKIPKYPSIPPTSVAQEFESLEVAVATLDRWAIDLREGTEKQLSIMQEVW